MATHSLPLPIELSEVTLPAYYASAFINGDFSGIETEEEVAHVQSIIDSLASDGWAIVDVKRDEEGNGEEPRFTWCYQLYNAFGNASGGDVLDYVVHKQVSERAMRDPSREDMLAFLIAQYPEGDEFEREEAVYSPSAAHFCRVWGLRTQFDAICRRFPLSLTDSNQRKSAEGPRWRPEHR